MQELKLETYKYVMEKKINIKKTHVVKFLTLGVYAVFAPWKIDYIMPCGLNVCCQFHLDRHD